MKTTQNIFTKTLRLVHYYPRSIWWITTRVMLLTILVATARMCLQPQYTARSTMTTLPSGFELKYTEARMDVRSALGPAMVLTQTHTEYLLSRTIAEDVIAQLQSEGLPVDNGPFSSIKKPVRSFLNSALTLVRYGRIMSVPPEDALIDRLRRATTVRNVPGSFILEIAVRWPNPVVAARAVNTITDRYVSLVREANQQEMRVTREFINGRIAETLQALDKIDTSIKTFKGEKRFYQGKTDFDLKMDEMATYLKEMRKSQAVADDLEERLTVLKNYQSPAVLSDLTAELAGARARTSSLEQSYKAIEEELNRFPALEQELLALFRERAERAANLETLQESLTRTEIAEASQLSSVRTIDRAAVPRFPSGSNLVSSGLSAILVGLILSAVYIATMEYVRPQLRSRSDFENRGVSLQGLIPYDQHSASRSRIELAADNANPDRKASRLDRFVYGCQVWERGFRRKESTGRPPASEGWTLHNRRAFINHVDHLVAHLTESCRGVPVVFTSLDEERGKSFVIEHLAFRAVHSGKKVLIIEANTDYPRMRQAFGIQSVKATFADVRSGKSRLQEAILTAAAGIDLVPAEKQSADSRKEWDVASLREQLRSISQQYDLVMIDTVSLRIDPLVKRLWDLSGHMVCILDATTCTMDSFDDLQGRVARYENKVDYVLNYVRFSGDYLYES